MNSLTEYLTFNTKTRRAFVNITSQIEKLVKKSQVKEGLCLVNAMHITASVFVNDNESGLHKDYEEMVCGVEHHMNKQFTDALCTMLHHPRKCPHDHDIPPGECCNQDNQSKEDTN